MRRFLFGLCLISCVDLELDADLEGPRVYASSLPRTRNVEVPTGSALTIEFTEAIDAGSVRAALVAWEEVGRCDYSPRCAEGSCERGRCMRDPLSAAAAAKLASGPVEGVGLQMRVGESSSGPGDRLTIAPTRALVEYTRYSLLVFARDRSGAPLVDEAGTAGVWRRELVTGGEGSGGPEARLVAPASGSEGVPPNLAAVATEFARPVLAEAEATLSLVAMDGSVVRLVEPTACAGWVPGTCLRWRPEGPVLADMSYRTGGGSLRDALGQVAVAPATASWFSTASEPDTTAPALAVEVASLGPCVYAQVLADEPLQVTLTIAGQVDAAVAGPGPVRLGLRWDEVAEEAAIATVRAEDLAGNVGERSIAVVREPGSIPPLGLAEILANPRGPEPTQEFLELVDLREAGEPREWTDLRVTDRRASALVGSLADGEAPGDPLPAFVTRPGERVLVVAEGYDPREGSDPAPAPGTALVRVDASLAAGGLKNAGEAVSLYFGTGKEAVIVASYDDHVATGAPAHAGRSVVADPRACDLARAWRSQPGGTATPGAP